MRHFIVRTDKLGRNKIGRSKLFWGYLDSQNIIHFSEINGTAHFRTLIIKDSPRPVLDAYGLDHETLIANELPEKLYSEFK